MKNLLILLILLIFNSCNSQVENKNNQTKPFWTKQKLKERAKSQNNPDSLDMNRLSKVSQYAEKMWEKDVPIHFTAFPTLNYESAGNANKPLTIDFQGKKLITESISLGKDKHNEHRFTDESKQDEIVFTIIVLSNEKDSTQTSYVSSRNHPNYIAEGSIKSNNKPIDWVSIQNADDSAYSIVSMRLFNLNFGQVVIVAPQKDDTLRFLQIQREFLSNKDLEEYLKELIKQEKIKTFLTMEGNI
jgi:hypothetical protein